jgi:hypothetical protein
MQLNLISSNSGMPDEDNQYITEEKKVTGTLMLARITAATSNS